MNPFNIFPNYKAVESITKDDQSAPPMLVKTASNNT